MLIMFFVLIIFIFFDLMAQFIVNHQQKLNDQILDLEVELLEQSFLLDQKMDSIISQIPTKESLEQNIKLIYGKDIWNYQQKLNDQFLDLNIKLLKQSFLLNKKIELILSQIPAKESLKQNIKVIYEKATWNYPTIIFLLKLIFLFCVATVLIYNYYGLITFFKSLYNDFIGLSNEFLQTIYNVLKNSILFFFNYLSFFSFVIWDFVKDFSKYLISIPINLFNFIKEFFLISNTDSASKNSFDSDGPEINSTSLSNVSSPTLNNADSLPSELNSNLNLDETVLFSNPSTLWNKYLF